MNRATGMCFLMAAGALLAAGGCAPTAGPTAQAAAEIQMPPETDDGLPEAVFLGELAAQDRVNQNDGFRAVLIWLEAAEEADNFKDRCLALADRGLIQSRWRLNPHAPLDKATLAYILYKALGLRGGVNMELFNNRRYALREMVYRRLMARGADYAYVSGSELIGLLGRADDRRAAEADAPELPEMLRE